MKKFFFMTAAATVLFAACQKTEVVYNEGPQEIALTAVSNLATKTPVDGVVFKEGDNMSVAAYLVSGATQAGDFFNKTEFVYSAGTTWHGDPARYWPITSSTINFLAVTEKGGGVDHTTVSFKDTKDYASSATVVLANNNVSDQNDVMFAAGTQSHVEGDPYKVVPMVFKHALAWVNFTVKTNTHNSKVTVNSITLNNAAYNGTLTLTNEQYYSTTANVTNNVTATWAKPELVNAMLVPNGKKGEQAAKADAVELTSTSAATAFGNGLLVIPNNGIDGFEKGAESFTINYTLTQEDGTKLTYDYTHKFAPVWEMAKKYTYNITINLTEILIKPTVTDWVDEPGVNVPLDGYTRL